MNFHDELSTALEAAKSAGTQQLNFQNSFSQIEYKEDRSPVTEVDKKCENIIRDKLLKYFPNDGFLGEETGSYEGNSGRRWIVDPLDGTRPFIRGIPTFSTLIALEQENEPVLGIIHLPALNLTCWAFKNGGAFLNDKPIHVSNTTKLDCALGSALGFLEKADSTEGKKLFSLMQLWDYAYGFMDAYSYLCVASGKIDLSVNLLDKAWDCAAAACIVTEAGGEFSDITGIHSVHNGSIILSNGHLHSCVLNHFET